MEDVMYGVILNAKMDIVSNEPPVNSVKKVKRITGLVRKASSEYRSDQLPVSEAEIRV